VRKLVNGYGVDGRFAEEDLGDADLSGADLRGADLSGANLTGSILRDTIIDEDTKLDPKWLVAWRIVNEGTPGKNLTDFKDLRGAYLAGADLSSAKLAGVDLSEANLAGVDLTSADLTDARLGGANLSNARLINAKLAGAVFSNADLSGASVNWHGSVEHRFVWCEELPCAESIDDANGRTQVYVVSAYWQVSGD
jgi:uncharacterized protein YjbI with pentapeptide repeats